VIVIRKWLFSIETFFPFWFCYINENKISNLDLERAPEERGFSPRFQEKEHRVDPNYIFRVCIILVFIEVHVLYMYGNLLYINVLHSTWLVHIIP
jgi:hypothetical protein